MRLKLVLLGEHLLAAKVTTGSGGSKVMREMTG